METKYDKTLNTVKNENFQQNLFSKEEHNSFIGEPNSQ